MKNMYTVYDHSELLLDMVHPIYLYPLPSPPQSHTHTITHTPTHPLRSLKKSHLYFLSETLSDPRNWSPVSHTRTFESARRHFQVMPTSCLGRFTSLPMSTPNTDLEGSACRAATKSLSRVATAAMVEGSLPMVVKRGFLFERKGVGCWCCL
jgi:hypothetical protein